MSITDNQPITFDMSSLGVRLQARYLEAADTVFMDGSTPWEVDEAMENFGFKLGPFKQEDITGLDHGSQLRRQFRAIKPEGRREIPLIGRMLELGKLGRKTGAGWYRYPGGGGAVEDPIVADLAIEESYFHNNTRTDYSENEIKERLILSLISEALLPHEGLYPDPDEIDQAALAAINFPQTQGSLMNYADQLGASHIIDCISDFAAEEKSHWPQSPVLIKAMVDNCLISDALKQMIVSSQMKQDV